MENRIIISADEQVVCPKCANQFTLEQGISRQTIERYAVEYDAAFQSERKALVKSLEEEAERHASRKFKGELAKLEEALAASKKAERTQTQALQRVQTEARAKALEEFALEKRLLAEELADKETKLKEHRTLELDLRRQKKQLEEQQANLQLQLERQLDEARKLIAEEISQRESQRFALIEAEYRKKINDAHKANDDLRRKLEQGSQQLQGEVLELEVEHVLSTSFVHDQIEAVKKGARGADVVQTVRTPVGQICGRIIWEAKRAENWSEKWLQKLRDDQQEAGADIAVLVSTAMPKGMTEPFMLHGDIWLVSPHLIRPLAEALRVVLLEAQKLKLVNSGRDEKMELLYNYLTSPLFAQRIGTVLEVFETMRVDLETEKRTTQKRWAKQQAQLDRLTTSMVSVVGELQAIAHEELPQLASIEVLGHAELDD